VVVAEVDDGVYRGRGECVPYLRYHETTESVAAAIASLAPQVAEGLDRMALQGLLSAGAARNALDCALWDLDAKRAARPVHALAGLPPPGPRVTAYTISLDTPDAMAAAVAKAGRRPLLKVKLGRPGDPDRIRAVRAAAPNAELIVDANEGWNADNLANNLAACAAVGVTLIEQPLPAGDDDALAQLPHPITVCADESVHDRASLRGLAGKYDAVNVKLDKAGGLTEALALAAEAKARGFGLMVGSMVGTSLSVAQALILAQGAAVADLDGPLLLAEDRQPGLSIVGSLIEPPPTELWG
jgi:L-alanine-DL-glutamate epimerase-like enolase superfamily enzyme